MKPHLFVAVLLFSLNQIFAKYALPELSIQAFTPKGLRVTMPVVPGEQVQLFGFHANINKGIRGKEQGDISRSATKSHNNVWTLTDNNVELKVGDRLHYWVFAQNNRLGFDKEDQTYEVTALLDPKTVADCPSTPSRKSAPGKLCANDILFEDNFRGDKLDESLWEVLQYTPAYVRDGGMEFVSYENRPETLFVKNEVLHVKPIYVGDREQDLPFVLPGCTEPNTPEACEISGKNSYEIRPPVVAARIRTKVAFKYGRVEIKATLPMGDWIVPHLVLEPRDFTYGKGIASGEMYVAYARGNRDLTLNGDDIGQNVLFSGPVLDKDRTANMLKTKISQPWGTKSHVFSIEWSPDGCVHWVDGKVRANSSTPANGYKSMINEAYSNNWKTKDAPFDQYFVLNIGLSVGGQIDFPEGISNRGVMKPWKNTDPRAAVSFFKKAKDWEKTWSDNSALKIEAVKVYAI